MDKRSATERAERAVAERVDREESAAERFGRDHLVAPAGPERGGPNGADVEADVSGYLDYLSRLCGELGVPDPVEVYFAPVVGRWSDMHDEAVRWRTVGLRADKVADNLTKPLGGLDAAWEGADADSFIDYMNRIGLAGHDMSDAMVAMSEVLDDTADGLREIVTDMAGLLADAADTASAAMAMPLQGEDRTRLYLDHMKRPTKELFESVRQVLEALVRLCEGIDGSQVFDKITMAHPMPAENWAFSQDLPVIPAPVDGSPEPAPEPVDAIKGGGSGGGGGAAISGGGGGGGASATPPTPQPGGYVMAGEAIPGPATGAAAAAASAGGGDGRSGTMGGGMMGGMPMGGMGGQQGGDSEHKNRNRLTADPVDIFGKPTKTSPSVIGED
ncbi:WXG100 family type VII secretion target [Actinokineospora sp.]|uniref:WXG100 family type VII secretion target n=1 Tax=Actinokineospora sp. TaxID=1872133 RepID=UPI003D6BBA07